MGLPVPMLKPVDVESEIIFLDETIDAGESVTKRCPSRYCREEKRYQTSLDVSIMDMLVTFIALLRVVVRFLLDR
jgi:hypothetical protein